MKTTKHRFEFGSLSGHRSVALDGKQRREGGAWRASVFFPLNTQTMSESLSLECDSSSALPLSVHPSSVVSQSFRLSHSGSLEPAVKTLGLKTEVDTNLSATQMSDRLSIRIKDHKPASAHRQ